MKGSFQMKQTNEEKNIILIIHKEIFSIIGCAAIVFLVPNTAISPVSPVTTLLWGRNSHNCVITLSTRPMLTAGEIEPKEETNLIG